MYDDCTNGLSQTQPTDLFGRVHAPNGNFILHVIVHVKHLQTFLNNKYVIKYDDSRKKC